MINTKYELLIDDTILVKTKTLYRIRALKDFGNVKAGDLGGYVESESNLDPECNAWIYDNACAWDYGQVKDNAKMFGDSRIFENGTLCNSSSMHDTSVVRSSAVVKGVCKLIGDTQCLTNPIFIYGLYYLVTITDNNIIVKHTSFTHEQWLDMTLQSIIDMNQAQLDAWLEEDPTREVTQDIIDGYDRMTTFWSKNQEFIKHFIGVKQNGTL